MQQKLTDTFLLKAQKFLLPCGVVGIESVAIPHINYTGQVSNVGREEPCKGDGDIVKDETLIGHCQLQACRSKLKIPFTVAKQMFLFKTYSLLST